MSAGELWLLIICAWLFIYPAIEFAIAPLRGERR